MKFFLLVISLWVFSLYCFAQAPEETVSQKENYLQVVNKRSGIIVGKLGITDSSMFYRVTDIIATQYIKLNEIQTAQDYKIKVIRLKAGADQSGADKDVQTISIKTLSRLDSLHEQFLSSLSKELSTQQIEKVKDGMTYGVLPITYKGYQEMLPDLTLEQKTQILHFLTEAREKAMDAGSSEEKHKWFGKYKGKINNYLSSEGYDMKKAGKEWAARIKAAETAPK